MSLRDSRDALQPPVPPGVCKCSLLSSRDSKHVSTICQVEGSPLQEQLALFMGQGAAASSEGQRGCCLDPALPGMDIQARLAIPEGSQKK